MIYRLNTAVPLTHFALDASGNRVTGLTTITGKVMRPSDGQVWDWAGGAFSASPASPTTTLAEIDATNMPGYYGAEWPGSSSEIDLITEVVPPSGLTADDRPVPANIFIRDYSTATAVAALQADVDDLSARLPASLVGGRIDASVGAVAANALTAAALAADAVTEIQAGLATAASIAALPSAAAIASAVDTAVTTSHGSGSYTTATGFAVAGDEMSLTTDERAAVADAVWDEALSGHATAGTAGAALVLVDVAVSSRATAAAVWATATDNADWTYGECVSLSRKHITNLLEVTTENDGTSTLYDDDGETPFVVQTLRDGSGSAITTPTGSPAVRGAAA